MFSVELIDYATPSYASFTKTYYGDKESILKVLNHPRTERPDMVEAANQFFNGTGEGKVQVYFGAPEPFIKQVRVIGTVEKQLDNVSFDHNNVWNCIYKMRAEHVSCRYVYIEDSDNKLYRCLGCDFTNLTSGDETESIPQELVREGKCWGHPGIIIEKATVDKDITNINQLSEGEKVVIGNSLMCREMIFNTMEELQKDMQDPCDLNFSGIFDDIFGDG